MKDIEKKDDKLREAIKDVLRNYKKGEIGMAEALAVLQHATRARYTVSMCVERISLEGEKITLAPGDKATISYVINVEMEK